jgi:Glycosyl hydrolase family 26
MNRIPADDVALEMKSTRVAELRRTGPRALVALALACALAIGLLTAGSAGAQPAAHASRAGKTPSIYWGAQIGDQLTGEQAPWDMGAVAKFEQLAGKKLSLVNFNAPFATCSGSHCAFNPFPTTPMEELRADGVIPVFSWSTSSVSEGTVDPKFALSKVIDGKYDAYIREFARSAAAWGHPFFLRFNWEMNGNWFPWAEGVNGNKKGQFVAAWRHVHDIFTSVGATNATWAWCPNVGINEKLRELYPGNKYVDWTCLDGYNWGTSFSWAHWQSFTNVFGSSYAAVRKVAPSKPMMIGEIASTEAGGSKPDWIKEMLTSVRTRFKKVHALLYFEVNDRGTHWPIESSRASTAAFASGIRNPAYLPSLFSNIESSPIPVPAR